MNFAAGLLLWTLYLPLHLGVQVVNIPLAPLAVEFFSTDDKRHLESPFTWLETIDNDLCGDSGWKTEHIEPGSDSCSTWNRTRWLWRNGAHGFNYTVIGTDAQEMPTFERGLTTREDGYWLYRNGIELNDEKSLEIFWGWHLYGNVNNMNKFVFTTRIKTTSQLGF